MNKQKRVLEIILYLALLIIFLFLLLTDYSPIADEKSTEDTQDTYTVPDEIIDYDFAFEED